ncbi:hypothetical protein KQI84_03015 [bacterium]|nr:hypothetical protein [bacterium]
MRTLCRLAVVILVLAAAVAHAQQPDPSPTPAGFVFVPYDKMEGPRFSSDQSVLVPYAEFLRLKGADGPKSDSPEFEPVAAISSARYVGHVVDDVAAFDVELRIEVLARGDDFLVVPLPFTGAAIESATVEGPPASLAPPESGGGLVLTVRGEGERVLNLRLATQLETQGVEKHLRFTTPRAAASSIELHVPESVLLVEISDGLPARLGEAPQGESMILASAGSGDRVVLAYRPRAKEEGAAAETRLSVDQKLVLQVSPRDVQIRVRLSVDVLSGEAQSMALRVPPEVRLLGVSGSYLKSWSEPNANGEMSIELVRPMTENFEIALDAQMSDDNARLVIPEIRCMNAARESGTIVVVPTEGLYLWPDRTSGLDAISAVQAGSSSLAARAFQYAQPGWELALTRQEIPARLRAESIVLYEVTNDMVRIKSRHHIAVQARGIFGVTLEIPKDYELREAGPPDLVAGFRASDGRVEVNFRGEQRQAVDVELRLQRSRPSVEGRVQLQPIRIVNAEEDLGDIVLAAPLALKATEVEAKGLEPTDVRLLQGKLSNLRSSDLVSVLGYRYFSPTFQGLVAIERQRTRLTCETENLVSIMPSLMRIDATMNYTVEFSATDEFQLLVPTSAGEDVRITGADIKEKVRSTPGPNDELTTWTVRLQRRVLGGYTLRASFDVPLEGAESGKPVNVSVPIVCVAGVARETGHVAVARGENLEVRASVSEGLEVRDVKELPASLANAFLGFRYFEPREVDLKLELIRHELESVLGALIRRMHIDSVVNEQEKIVHEVYLEVQNNREQYLELKLPKGVEIWSASVRGASVRPAIREADGASLIELTKSESKDSAFRVRLIMHQTLEGNDLGRSGTLRFDPPEPLNIPVLRTTWRLFLPRDYRYVNFGGTMRLNEGGTTPWIEPATEALLNDLPAGIAGGVARPSLNPRVSHPQMNYDAQETDAERQARLQGAALDIAIVKEGAQFQFSKLSGVGTIEVDYWKRKSLVILQLVIGIVVFLGLMVAMGGSKRLSIGAAAVVVAFILASLTDGLWGRLFATALAASLAALALGIVLLFVGKARVAAQEIRNRPKPEPTIRFDESLMSDWPPPKPKADDKEEPKEEPAPPPPAKEDQKKPGEPTDDPEAK